MVYLAFKQVGLNVVEYAILRLWTGRKLKKVDNLFAERKEEVKGDKIKYEYLKTHEITMQQLAMSKQKETLVFSYNEQFI